VLVDQAEKHISWALEQVHDMYERVEAALAVLMIRCLRPVGVRDASEITTLCPNMKQVCSVSPCFCRNLILLENTVMSSEVMTRCCQ
jgi:hypothetical protein